MPTPEQLAAFQSQLNQSWDSDQGLVEVLYYINNMIKELNTDATDDLKAVDVSEIQYEENIRPDSLSSSLVYEENDFPELFHRSEFGNSKTEIKSIVEENNAELAINDETFSENFNEIWKSNKDKLIAYFTFHAHLEEKAKTEKIYMTSIFPDKKLQKRKEFNQNGQYVLEVLRKATEAFINLMAVTSEEKADAIALLGKAVVQVDNLTKNHKNTFVKFHSTGKEDSICTRLLNALKNLFPNAFKAKTVKLLDTNLSMFKSSNSKSPHNKGARVETGATANPDEKSGEYSPRHKS